MEAVLSVIVAIKLLWKRCYWTLDKLLDFVASVYNEG